MNEISGRPSRLGSMLHPRLDAQRRYLSRADDGETLWINSVAGVFITYAGTMLVVSIRASFEEHAKNGFNAILQFWACGGLAIILTLHGVVMIAMFILACIAARCATRSSRGAMIALEVGSVWFLWTGPVLWTAFFFAGIVSSTTSPPFLSDAMLILPFFPTISFPILWTLAAMRGINALTQ